MVLTVRDTNEEASSSGINAQVVKDERSCTKPICDFDVDDPAMDDDGHHHPEHHRAKENYFSAIPIYARKDSIQIQILRDANDDELHEENPHLRDYLKVNVENQHEEKGVVTDGETSDEEDSTGEDSLPEDTEQDTSTTEDVISFEVFKANYVPPAVSESQEEQEVKPKRKVHFGSVLVRDYNVTLGDHPSCSYGPPLTIDWDYQEYKPIDVNDYEFNHAPRRSFREMGLNYWHRRRILSEAGYTDQDLKKAWKQVKRCQWNRSVTKSLAVQYPFLSVAEDAVESSCRKIKRLIKKDHWEQQKHLYAK